MRKPLIACTCARNLIQELDLDGSILEGDSETSINAIWSKNLLQSSFGHIVKDIVSLTNSLQNFSFSCIIRQDNTLAHTLVKREKLSFPILLWIKVCPYWYSKDFCNKFFSYSIIRHTGLILKKKKKKKWFLAIIFTIVILIWKCLIKSNWYLKKF